MARMNIYLPDDLRARMRKLGDRVNWSSEAQDTFLMKCLIHESYNPQDENDDDHPLRVQGRQAARVSER